VADKLSSAAMRRFRRLRQTDDLSRLVGAASGTSVQLSLDRKHDTDHFDSVIGEYWSSDPPSPSAQILEESNVA